MWQVSNTYPHQSVQLPATAMQPDQSTLNAIQNTGLQAADLGAIMGPQHSECSSIVSTMMQYMQGMFNKMMNVIMSLIGRQPSGVAQLPYPMQSTDALMTRGPAELALSQEAVQGSEPSFFDQLGNVISAGEDLWTSGKEVWSTVSDTVGGWWDTASNWAGSAWNTARDYAGSTWSAVTGAASTVKDWISGIYSWFTS